jgi:ArsR family transcriptional regulator, arsenate/arsenite/antimonite-responsive transcriptional repressor
MTDLFDVLADDTRRDIVALLAAAHQRSQDMSVGELVEALGITQPTVSKHLKVLREAGVVRVREEGQHRFYRIDHAPLGEVSAWLGSVGGDSPASQGEPFVDLEVLGRAVGSLARDTAARLEGVVGKLFR